MSSPAAVWRRPRNVSPSSSARFTAGSNTRVRKVDRRSAPPSGATNRDAAETSPALPRHDHAPARVRPTGPKVTQNPHSLIPGGGRHIGDSPMTYSAPLLGGAPSRPPARRLHRRAARHPVRCRRHRSSISTASAANAAAKPSNTTMFFSFIVRTAFTMGDDLSFR